MAFDNLLFDGRIVKTKVMFEEENNKTKYNEVIKEEYNSVCDSTGNFFSSCHARYMSNAKVTATRIYEWLEERGFDKTIVAIRGDSTNVNTWSKGGAMAHLEKLF